MAKRLPFQTARYTFAWAALLCVLCWAVISLILRLERPTLEIAFTSTRSGSSDIYLMDVQSKLTVPLTRHAARDELPVWSPDGQYLVFRSERDTLTGELYVMDTNSVPRRISHNTVIEARPNWTPDGSGILYHSEGIWANGELYRIDVASGEREQITTHGITHIDATLSPDGRYVAFRGDTETDLFVLDLHSGHPQRLTSGPAWDTTPSWSPDSLSIAFISRTAVQRDLYITSRDGQKMRPITPGDGSSYQPVWSPDGRWIALVRVREKNQQGVYLVRDDGSEVRTLTASSQQYDYPRWSPDSRLIAFVSNRGGSWGLYIVGSNSEHLRLLTDEAIVPAAPAWRPR